MSHVLIEKVDNVAEGDHIKVDRVKEVDNEVDDMKEWGHILKEDEDLMNAIDDMNALSHVVMKFQNRQVFDWAQLVGKNNDFVVIMIRSDYGTLNGKESLTLGCEHGGKFKPYKGKFDIRV
ncbi:uncharacterized protein LOC130748639 [Lotus japonicus]|uniref:uncharacterized protein LOC130748639 n=1 Tax=Lotus japonicus TaxID=34305 RepID=UPI002582DBFE|nr:uncharacterized protein LOC130748639 [Lotus japonicus]XP_057457855.1 uncharacterized protein LOC130748639 [Lotus japonicus]XP_057457856.1 uncharacterized protein LOC130748639 [Lotus japonicus]